MKEPAVVRGGAQIRCSSDELTGRAVVAAILGSMSELVHSLTSTIDMLTWLGAARPGARAVILLGGADFAEADRRAPIRRFFGTLAAYCERTETAVADGGTDSGVMRLMAEARTSIGGRFRLIGVAPEGAFKRTTRTGSQIAMARDHDVVLLVPGSRFGDETPWLFSVGDHLGGGSAVTIVVNGGRLTLDEAHQRLAAGHSVVTVDGSGRAADELADELAADSGLPTSGRLLVIPLTVDDAGLSAAIEGPEAQYEGREP